MSESNRPNIVIQTRGLSVVYDRNRVLANINMELTQGSIYGVIGPNGAGKSTLFKAILGLIEDYVGEVKVFGGEAQQHRKRVAYVPQKDEVDWSFPASVRDVVEMGRYPHKSVFQRLSSNDRAITQKAMEELGIADLADRQIGMLSGGQQQRVFIARALCQEAELMLMDEPFVGVDKNSEEHIIRVLKDQAKQGKTLLVVHHDLATVHHYFDKLIMINHNLIALGPTEEVFTPANLARCFGGQLSILHQISQGNFAK